MIFFILYILSISLYLGAFIASITMHNYHFAIMSMLGLAMHVHASVFCFVLGRFWEREHPAE